jgi:hypothetical protein
MSSLPHHQQSLAGGIFNTVTKICSAVGLGISASIYSAESSGTDAFQTNIKPYRSVFWFCVASAGLGLCFVPFLTIGTQGHEINASNITNRSGEKINEESKDPRDIHSKDICASVKGE